MKYKAYKLRIYPNKEQEILIAKTFGACRFVYNKFLEANDKLYKSKEQNIVSYFGMGKELTKFKKSKEYQFLNEVESDALRAALKHLAEAYQAFFKKRSNFPKFKNKKSLKQSYSTGGGKGIKVKGNFIQMPKVGLLRFRDKREITGKIKEATLTRRPSGKYFLSLICEEEIPELPKTKATIGIDLGVKDLITLSNGEKIKNQKFNTEMHYRIKRAKRSLSRMQEAAKKAGKPLKYAKNYQKQKIKVAKLIEKEANKRAFYLSEITTDLIQKYDIICVENLNVSEMMQNKDLARNIADASFARFIQKLEYKAEWYGKTISIIDRWYPSTKKCSNCGEVGSKKPLDVRKWECKKCGAIHDRDINAAINIEKEGLRLLEI